MSLITMSAFCGFQRFSLRHAFILQFYFVNGTCLLSIMPERKDFNVLILLRLGYG